VTEEAQRRLDNELSVDAVDEDAWETDDASDKHCGVHLRLWQLDHATTQRLKHSTTDRECS